MSVTVNTNPVLTSSGHQGGHMIGNELHGVGNAGGTIVTVVLIIAAVIILAMIVATFLTMRTRRTIRNHRRYRP